MKYNFLPKRSCNLLGRYFCDALKAYSSSDELSGLTYWAKAESSNKRWAEEKLDKKIDPISYIKEREHGMTQFYVLDRINWISAECGTFLTTGQTRLL